MTKNDILKKMGNDELLNYLLEEIEHFKKSDSFRFVYAKPIAGNSNKPVYILEAKMSDWIEIAEMPEVVFTVLTQQYHFGNQNVFNGYCMHLGDSLSGSQVHQLVYAKTRKGIIDEALNQLE